MINILERYIGRTIVAATLLATLLITAVLFLMSLLGELKNIGEGDFGFTQAILYIFLRLPNSLYQFSPILILLGSIIGLSLLSSSRELAVMRTSGFSVRKIIRSVLAVAFFIIILITLVGEWLGPNLSYKAEIYKENAQNAGEAVITAAGVWFHIDNNFIHVRHVVGRQLLEGVTRYEFDSRHRLLAAYYAKTLHFERGQWRTRDVVKTTFYNDRTKSQSLAQAAWDFKFNTNLLNVGLVNPEEMSLLRLNQFAKYLVKNGLQANEYEYNFWQRVFQPLASLVMVFLAIPFVLRTLSSSTLGWRVLIGILMGFVFFILNAFLGQLCVVYQLPAFLAALLPAVAFATFGLFLYRNST